MPNPNEMNILNNVQYKFEVHSLPNVNYWCQTAILPSIQLDGGMVGTPRTNISIPGNKTTFDPLNITFIVDQDLANYEEIVNWMLNIQTEPNYSGMVSDASFHFLTGNMNVSRTVVFRDLSPIILSELSMTSNDSDTIQTECTCTFRYNYFTFESNTTHPY